MPAREFYAYDRFARVLGEVMGRVAEISERRPEEASGAGLFLMHLDPLLTLDLAERAAKGLHEPRRIVLLNGPREDAIQAVEQGSVLGAVFKSRYLRWQHDQERRVDGDIFGPWSLAPALAPHMTPTGAIQTEQGVLYESAPSLSLPAALALYLSACADRAGGALGAR
jgi:hypothetical protein